MNYRLTNSELVKDSLPKPKQPFNVFCFLFGHKFYDIDSFYCTSNFIVLNAISSSFWSHEHDIFLLKIESFCTRCCSVVEYKHDQTKKKTNIFSLTSQGNPMFGCQNILEKNFKFVNSYQEYAELVNNGIILPKKQTIFSNVKWSEITFRETKEKVYYCKELKLMRLK